MTYTDLVIDIFKPIEYCL